MSSDGSRPASDPAVPRAPKALPPLRGRTDLRHLVPAGPQLSGLRARPRAGRAGLLARRLFLQSDGGGDAVRRLGVGTALVDLAVSALDLLPDQHDRADGHLAVRVLSLL